MPDIGHGTQLQKDVSSTYVGIANVYDISGPNLTRDDVEVTTYDSSERYREYIPGLREGGEITVMANLVSSAAGLQGLFHSTAVQTTAGGATSTSAEAGAFESSGTESYRILGPNTDFWNFTGYVKGWVQAQPIDDRRTYEITFKVTGRPTLAHGATTVAGV